MKVFNQFLKDNYSSYSGFISFTANNYNEWLEDFKSNEDLAIGAVLSFIFADVIKEDRENDYLPSFTDYVIENTFYSEFVDTIEIDVESDKLKMWVQNNYINSIDADSLSVEFIETIVNKEFIQYSKAIELIKAHIKEIDSHTLEIQF